MQKFIPIAIIVIYSCMYNFVEASEKTLKKTSVLFSHEMIRTATENAEKFEWAADIRKKIIEDAQPWMNYSDEDLWNMMFGNTISRSWMVWSDGYCPACKNDVRMYSWEIDPHNMPWKVLCPKCGEMFPKNDFHAYYLSGFDQHGIFNPEQADRKLLYNSEHPDPADSLYGFGVDDGEGYVDGGNRWRFIGAYLIYGQWKKAIVDGIRNLAAAYIVTGDRVYAHKAGILLDRVADLYATFDFGEQGIVYERKGDAGYISTWHDACREHHEIVVAYDQIFEALLDDKELVAFLSGKALEYKLDNPKTTFSDIQRNIEDGILRDAIKNRHKINSNYPTTEIALILTHTVLNWPENRDAVYGFFDDMVKQATAVDGLSGEKGLAAYSSYPIDTMAQLFEMFARMDPTFLPDLIERHPNLKKTYRFHIDMWFNGEYYPQVGDTGGFALKYDHFPTARTSANPGVGSSMFSFLKRLYEITGDHAYIQLLYRENNKSAENLPYDLFDPDPEAFQYEVEDIIARKGAEFNVGSVNKEEWCLAMMRSGKGKLERAFWIDYDSGERHSHIDCMNLGLFAKGLDLMPEMGYPPVQYGGWGSPRALWVRKTAAHNTVVVDGKDQDNPRNRHIGKTTLWADGKNFRAIRVSDPEVYDIERYERTVALVDLSENDSYLLDIFRVKGGSDHAKFMHSHFGIMNVYGLSLKAAEDYGNDTIMRNFYCDSSPKPGWQIDWRIDDRLGYLPSDADVFVRYTDLTTDAEAFTAEGWITSGSFNESRELWIPRILVRRKTEQAPLSSTFVSIIEPYESFSKIKHVERYPLTDVTGKTMADGNVAVEVELIDGRRHVMLSADNGNSPDKMSSGRILALEKLDVQFDGDLCLLCYDEDGNIERLSLYGGTVLKAGDVEVISDGSREYLELQIDRTNAVVLSGKSDMIRNVKNGTNILRVK
ncbi:MAG: heparinase II/III family protein [Candidatus Latescibacteria bacterium]|nr:heparinase II/III family protein [Candidatus Latescibacterota bacterium]